jgi:membrane protease subunit HflC
MSWLRLVVALFVVLVAAIGVASCFVVDTSEYAIVTRFGQPIETYRTPGLRARIPVADQVVRVDARLLLTDPPVAEYLTLDKKNVVARVFLTWKVDDPLRYVQTVQNRESAEMRLAALTSSEIGAAFGSVPFDSLVSPDPEKMRLDETVSQVEARIREVVAAQYGIELVSLRVERLAFPSQNEESVFQRMRAERERIARQFRSEGEEAALKVKAAADRERAQILSDAERKAAEIRGGAEAEAARVYSDALGSDPDFYRFSRTLEAYDKIIDKNTTIVLPADSPLMKGLTTGPPGLGVAH